MNTNEQNKVLSQDNLKLTSAKSAFDYILNLYQQQPKNFDNSYIGIGTGSTANFFIDLISKNDDFKRIFKAAICSSNVSEQRLVANNFPIISLTDFHENSPKIFIPFYIDGADEINENLQMIKGGGGALTKEKIVATMSQKFLCLADETKLVNKLGKFPLAVEVLPSAKYLVIQKLNELNELNKLNELKNIKIIKITERKNFITDSNNLILDLHFANTFDNQQAMILEQTINNIVGVVENGLFTQHSKAADVLFLATQNGIKNISKE